MAVTSKPMWLTVNAQFDRFLDDVTERLPAVAGHPDAARAALLAFTTVPKGVRMRLRSHHPPEQFNESRRRTDAVAIFPTREAIFRLAGTVLAEQTGEWVEGRRYLRLEALTPADSLS